LVAVLLMAAWPQLARAEDKKLGDNNEQALTETDPLLKPKARRWQSPERFMLELRGGVYSPNGMDLKGYGRFFADDAGPNIGFHFDGIAYRQDNWFYLTAGGSLGYIGLSGKALPIDPTFTVDEETTLAIIPLVATIGLRVDALARKLRIPLIFAGRVGWEWAHWDTNKGLKNDATGWSLGPFFSAQVAFDLDAIEPGSARNLDEEFGINHTYLFGEVYSFVPVSKQLPIGDTNWLVGLGMIF
jgi:hypothetical protein